MNDLFISLGDLVVASWSLLRALAGLIFPWLPLLGWVAFWLLAVNWTRLRDILIHKGGLLGVGLIGAVTVLIWGAVAPPEGGQHFLLGLTVSNYVGKLVYVTGLFVLMFLCGSVQLSGSCNCWCDYEPEAGGGHGGHSAPDDGHGHAAH